MQRGMTSFVRMVRLTFAILAVVGLLARILVPMPAEARGTDDLTATLLSLGADICHADDNGPTPDPAQKSICDHCTLCTVHHVAIAEPSGVSIPVPTPSVTVDPPSRRAVSDAQPRAPPHRAHPPRAPPTV